MAYTRVTRTCNGRGALEYAYGKDKGHNGNQNRNEMISCVNLLPGVDVATQMEKHWNKARSNHKTQVIRIVQSFSINELNPDEPADILTANMIGQEYAQRHYKGRQCVVFTQTDGKSGLVHNHIIVSDTDMETSKGCDRQQYYQPTLMQWTDELVREHGIELDEGTAKTKDKSTQTERAKRDKGEYVWKDDLKMRIMAAMNESENEDEWLKNLPGFGVNIEVHDSKKRGRYYTYELMDTSGFAEGKKIPQNLKSRSYKMGTMYDAEGVQSFFKEKEQQKELEHKLHGNRNSDNEHVTVNEDEHVVSGVVQDDVPVVPKHRVLDDEEEEKKKQQLQQRRRTGSVQIVVPDGPVPHWEPNKVVNVDTRAVDNVDERDNIEVPAGAIIGKQEDKKQEILAMRLQQKIERDRRRRRVQEGVTQVHNDTKHIKGLSADTIMERIRDVQQQDEKDDRSL